MAVFEPLIQGYSLYFTGITLLMSVLGCFIGLVLGVIPGLGPLLGIILLMPFTLVLEPTAGMALLIAVFVGGSCGGAISAILLRIPGTPLAAATLLDGYPMAKNGRANEAISIATSASALGGLIGGVLLIIGSVGLAQIALQFAAPEYFMLTITGLISIAVVSHESTLKGLLMGSFGLLLSTIGMDKNSLFYRFDLGIDGLQSGLHLVALVVGLFAISEVFLQIGQKHRQGIINTGKLHFSFYGISSVLKRWGNLLQSSAIGTFLGALPGAGGIISAFTAYALARAQSKTPENFGKGDEDGVLACESANNACCGGALVPSLAFGIPGDATTSLLLGAMVLLGFYPGPDLFENNLDIVGGIFWAYLVANIVLLLLAMLIMPLFTSIVKIKKCYLMPIILLISVLSTFSLQGSFFDIYVMLCFGFIGYMLRRYGFPLSPIVIGFVLGPIGEKNLRTALVISGDEYSIFWDRPISATLLAINLCILMWIILPASVKQKFKFWQKPTVHT